MRALTLTDTGLKFRPDAPLPVVRPGEVLVRVLMAGICETDLQLVRGYMGFRGILGHEFVGIAEQGPFQGQRVVGEINCSCDRCETCRAGQRNHCPQRTVLGILNHDGAFADYIAVPQANLHVVPEHLETRVAVFTEPLAAAFQIPAQVPLHSKLRVIILGDGRLGNLCARVVRLSGCSLLVVGKHPRKLELLSCDGIDTALLQDVPDSRQADIVVDCTGSATGLPLALRLVRPRGTVVLKTTVAGEQKLALAPIVIDEISVIGSRCGPFGVALEALADERIDVTPLIDAIFPFSGGLPAFEQAGTPGVMKVLLDVETPETGGGGFSG